MQRPWRQIVVGSCALLSAGCGDSDDKLRGPSDGDACGSTSISVSTTTGLNLPVPVEGSACGAEITEEAEGSFEHVEDCSVVRYSSNPPSSGPHYASWAAFQVYDRPVARGFWMHSLEHGAVAFLHNCDDCADEIAAASALIDELPEDPLCARGPARRRVLMTPDPLLDVPWAIAAWRFTLRTSCFEAEVFRSFAEGRYARGRENTCAEGRTF